MTGKSYVTLEQHVCTVCDKPFDTGVLLLDKRLQERFDRKTVTGYGLCEEHQKMKDDGFIALIECDPSKSKIETGPDGVDSALAEDVHRTGNILHTNAASWPHLFDTPVPPNGVGFVDIETFTVLAKHATFPKGESDVG